MRAQLECRIKEINLHRQTAPDAIPEIRTLPARNILRLSENIYRDEDLDIVIKKMQKEHEGQLYIIGNGDIGSTIPLEELDKTKFRVRHSEAGGFLVCSNKRTKIYQTEVT